MRCCFSSVWGWSPPLWLGHWEFLALWTCIADHIPNLKTETINSKHRTQLQMLTYKLQVSKLTCALLVSTSVLMCNAKRLAVASLENGTYVTWKWLWKAYKSSFGCLCAPTGLSLAGGGSHVTGSDLTWPEETRKWRHLARSHLEVAVVGLSVKFGYLLAPTGL